jgi:hypothetical protein
MRIRSCLLAALLATLATAAGCGESQKAEALAQPRYDFTPEQVQAIQDEDRLVEAEENPRSAAAAAARKQ